MPNMVSKVRFEKLCQEIWNQLISSRGLYMLNICASRKQIFGTCAAASVCWEQGPHTWPDWVPNANFARVWLLRKEQPPTVVWTGCQGSAKSKYFNAVNSCVVFPSRCHNTCLWIGKGSTQTLEYKMLSASNSQLQDHGCKSRTSLLSCFIKIHPVWATGDDNGASLHLAVNEYVAIDR